MPPERPQTGCVREEDLLARVGTYENGSYKYSKIAEEHYGGAGATCSGILVIKSNSARKHRVNNKITKCIYRMSDPKRSKLFVAHYSGPSTLHRNERGVELGLIGNEKQRTKSKSRDRNGRTKDGAGVSTVAMSTLDS